MMPLRTILITGATGKIGRNLVQHFMTLGFTVVATSRSQANLEAMATDFAGLTGQLATVVTDLRAESPAVLAERLAGQDLQPHFLVNATIDS